MTEKRIKTILACDVAKKVFHLNRTEYRGWEANLGMAHEYQDRIEAKWREFNKQNVRLFISSSVLISPTSYWSPLLIIPDMPALEVIEFAKVGTHNNKSDNWTVVLEVMSKIYKKNPFDVQFADEAGLKATFLDAVSKSDANEIDKMIARLNPEVMDAIDEDSIRSLVLNQKRLRLWWD